MNVEIDYYPSKKIPDEDKIVYLDTVKNKLPFLLRGLEWLKNKEGHILHIEAEVYELPCYLIVYWESNVLARIELHDRDWGLHSFENEIGLVQVAGLYTRKIKSDLIEQNRIQKVIIDAFKKTEAIK